MSVYDVGYSFNVQQMMIDDVLEPKVLFVTLNDSKGLFTYDVVLFFSEFFTYPHQK